MRVPEVVGQARYGETAILTVVKRAALFALMLAVEGVLASLSALSETRRWE